MNFTVPYNYLPEQFKDQEQIFNLLRPIFSAGEFTLGPYVEKFEEKFANFIGSKYCIATNNGTDALILALKALGIKSGDEVLTPCNSFYATSGAIVAVGATPIFIDVDERYQIDIAEIEKFITSKTKMILPVHWAGASPDMFKIREIADQYGLYILEDACMAIGGKIMNRNPGSFSEIAAFSMHPLKTLNVAGDGGMIITNDSNLFEWMKKYRNHGMVDRDHIDFWGVNMRIQPIQAAIASYFLDYVDGYVMKRNKNAKYLDSLLLDLEPKIKLPPRPSNYIETFSLYMILVSHRNELLEYLNINGVEAKIHYPVPLHQQVASKQMGLNKRVLKNAEIQADMLITLPIHQYLDENHMQFVSKLIHTFYQECL
jgi:aminotransferase EvaB